MKHTLVSITGKAMARDWANFLKPAILKAELGLNPRYFAQPT